LEIYGGLNGQRRIKGKKKSWIPSLVANKINIMTKQMTIKKIP